MTRSHPDSDPVVDPVLDRFFEHYFHRRPVNATFTGMYAYDANLPDWSRGGLEETGDEMTALRRDLALQWTGPSDAFAAIDRKLADGFLEIQVAELEGDHFQRGNPALYTGEAIFAVLSLMLRDFTSAEQRVDAIARRLTSIPGFLRSAQRTIGNKPVPRSWTARALSECYGGVHAFGDGLESWCHSRGFDERSTSWLNAAAERALSAVSGFRSWLGSIPDVQARRSGCGPEFYDLLLRRGHWDTRTRDDLLAEAWQQFEQAEARLGEMARSVDSGGWPAVAARLAELHPSLDNYLDAYQRTWDACHQIASQRELINWPSFPIRYVPIPEWVREAAPNLYFLHYRSPAPYDLPEVVDYLVPPIDDRPTPELVQSLLRATNDSVIKLNHVIHHGALGHHVQNSYAYRSASRVGQIAAVDCASRIGMFCGGSLAEGWACYATDLMGEVGFLSELELVAEQHSRLRQLGRAIVDIELHQHSIAEGEARRFYEERVGMTSAAAAKEVTRDSMFPGTAVMYWLGTQGIHDLRIARQQAEGAAFSLREFHDKLLSFGSIPVLLIAQLMSGSALV